MKSYRFSNPKQEQECCDVLRAYVQEFGPEYVCIYFPTVWEAAMTGEWNCAARRFFQTEDFVGIQVEIGGRVEYQWSVRLETVCDVPAQ